MSTIGRSHIGITLCLALNCGAWVHAAGHQVIPPADGSVWVFLGDSITSQQLHTIYMESYFHLRYPERHLHFRNAGRGGSRIPEGMQRFEREVAGWKPTHVSVHFGMNDRCGPAERRAPKAYRANLEKLCGMITGLGATPVLFSPHPIYRREDGGSCLSAYSKICLELAGKKGWPGTDQFHLLLPIWARNWKSPKPVDLQFGTRKGKPDTVHPGPSGQLMLAYALLKGLGVPSEVSAATIDARTGKLIKAKGCKVEKIRRTATGVSFERIDERLPMAFDDRAREALKLMPEILDINRYLLTIKGLAPGAYAVRVDGQDTAEVNARDLAGGWNMAGMTKGPIHAQLQQVLLAIRKKEGVSAKSKRPEGVNRLRSAGRYHSGKGLKGKDLLAKLHPIAKQILALDKPIHESSQPQRRRFEIVKSSGQGK